MSPKITLICGECGCQFEILAEVLAAASEIICPSGHPLECPDPEDARDVCNAIREVASALQDLADRREQLSEELKRSQCKWVVKV